VKKTVYCVGYAHLDPVYMWRWMEGVSEARATFQSALAILRDHPDVKFMTTTPWLFRVIERIDPELISRIRECVEQGRWELAGGMWVEPDLNIPGGESLVRQILHGQKALEEIFGRRATVAMNPDSFGHSAGLPQLLVDAGFQGYVFMRPRAADKPIPESPFLWRGVDGSTILCFQLPFYQSDAWEMRPRLEYLATNKASIPDRLLFFYGVGNHGGGPTRRNVAALREFDRETQDFEIRFARTDEYVSAVESEGLQIYPHGLLHWGRGCYSARAEVKRLCRQTELTLLNAEKMSSHAAVLAARPWPNLQDAWENLLFNQFHDILSGTSIQESSRDDRDVYGAALRIGLQAYNEAYQAIAGMVDTLDPSEEHKEETAHEDVFRYSEPSGHREFGSGVPLLLMNNTPWEFRGIVESELHDWRDSAIHCVDPRGAHVPCQLETGFGHPGAKLRRQRVFFQAEIPAGGFSVYTMRSKGSAAAQTIRRGKNTLENERIKLTLDEKTGFFESVALKQSNAEISFGGKGNRLLVLHDDTDTWGVRKDGVSIQEYTDEAGAFALEAMYPAKYGPVCASLRIVARYRTSRLDQEVLIFRDLPYIKVLNHLDWNEPMSILKACFPLSLARPSLWAEISAGAEERFTWKGEFPCQRWIDVAGDMPQKKHGFALISDAQHSYDFRENQLRMTLVRSPKWAFMYTNEEIKEHYYKVQDLGYHELSYYVLLHEGDWRDAHIPHWAETLNNPPFALPEYCHPGRLGKRKAFLSSSRKNIAVDALKRSYDATSWIIRTRETEGTASRGTIEWHTAGISFDVELEPFEIKTYGVDPWRGNVKLLNILEDETDQ